jgi:hypothetical protein
MRRAHLPSCCLLLAAVLLKAPPVNAYTPTHTFGPSPTPTATGTRPPPQASIAVTPNPARSGQRVVLTTREGNGFSLDAGRWRRDGADRGREPECLCRIGFGARGTVRDATSDEPIPAASVRVTFETGAQVSGTGGSDGSYSVSGSDSIRCNIDYRVSVEVSADGYYPFSEFLFTSQPLRFLDVRLDPVLTGDCNLDRLVRLGEIVLGVKVALEAEDVDRCPALDANGSGSIEVVELVGAVAGSLRD